MPPADAFKSLGNMGKRPLVMVVEDDANLRLMWHVALRLESFDVVEAASGLDALRVLDQGPLDLVVIDLGLPLLSGQSVLHEIAAQTLTRNIPVVIVTASVEDLSRLDVPCILRKPVTPDELVAAVRQCLPSGAPDARS